MGTGKNHQRKGSGGHPFWGRDQRAATTVPGKGSHRDGSIALSQVVEGEQGEEAED